MFVVFTVISDVCCRGGDRREDEEMVCVCVCVWWWWWEWIEEFCVPVE